MTYFEDDIWPSFYDFYIYYFGVTDLSPAVEDEKD
jgi:hypothetical protein